MRYKIVLTSSFKKELKTLKKRNKNLEKLTEVINKLANNEKLDEKYRDHALVNYSSFTGCRECHIEPDWLLVYKKNDRELILFLIETGSHSDLFWAILLVLFSCFLKYY